MAIARATSKVASKVKSASASVAQAARNKASSPTTNSTSSARSSSSGNYTMTAPTPTVPTPSATSITPTATATTTPVKTIADYKNDYNTAYMSRDYAAMRTANDGANGLRTDAGQATYNSGTGDAQRAGLTGINWSSTYTPQNTGTASTSAANTEDTDIQAKISALSDAQKQSQMTALAKARDNALSSLDSSVSTINDNYYGKRNQVAAQSDVGAMNFAQYMASRGVQGNAGAQPEIYRNAGLQSQIGALNNQQASDLTGVETNRNNIESNYQSDLAAAAADIEATKLQNYIAQINADRTYNADQAATAKSDYSNSLYAYSNDYQAEINRLLAAGVSADDYRVKALQSARAEKMAEQQAAATADAQQDPSYATALQAYNRGIRTDQILRVLGLA